MDMRKSILKRQAAILLAGLRFPAWLTEFGNPLIARRSVQEHTAIIRALKQGEGNAAAEAMKQNWLL